MMVLVCQEWSAEAGECWSRAVSRYFEGVLIKVVKGMEVGM